MINIFEILNPFVSGLTITFLVIMVILVLLATLRWRQLARAQRDLNAIIQDWTKDDVYLSSAQGYLGVDQEFERLQESFNHSETLSVLSQPLQEMRAALIRIPNGAQIAHSTSRYFNAERFSQDILTHKESRGLSFQALEAMPGLCTALGILGTFIGLVGGLSETGADGMPDIEQLVGGLHVSFKSSIYGLIASLFITMYGRRVEGKVSLTMSDFTSRLDHLLKQGTEHEVLTEILKAQRESSKALKSLKDDLCESMSIAIRQELAPVLNQAMSQSADAQMQGVSRIAEQVASHLGGQLEQAARRFEVAAEKVSHAANFWEQVAQSLAGLTQHQRTLLEQFNTLLQPLDVSLTQIQQTVSEISSAASASHETNESLRQASTLINESLSIFNTQMQATIEAANVTTEQLSEVGERWSSSSTELKEVAHELNQGFEIFVGQFPRAIENTMQEFDRELAKVAQRLVSASHDLQEGFDEVSVALSQVIQSSQAHQQVAQVPQQVVKQATRGAQQ